MSDKESAKSKRLQPIDPMNVPGGIMARLLGMSSQTLTKYVSEGRMVQKANRKYDLEDTIAAFIRYATGKSDALPAQRHKLLKQQERKIRLANDEASGKLMQTSGASDIWVEYCTRLRSGLAALPGRNASALSGMSDSKRIRALLSEEMQGILAYAEGAIPTLVVDDEETASNDASGSSNSHAKASKVA